MLSLRSPVNAMIFVWLPFLDSTKSAFKRFNLYCKQICQIKVSFNIASMNAAYRTDNDLKREFGASFTLKHVWFQMVGGPPYSIAIPDRG